MLIFLVEETHTRYTGIHGGDAVEYDSDAPALTVTSFQNTENSDGEAVISPLFARAGSKVTLLINSTEDLDVNTITATVCGLDETAATNPPIVTLINNNRTIKVTKVLGTKQPRSPLWTPTVLLILVFLQGIHLDSQS